jgi:hypothetical protein
MLDLRRRQFIALLASAAATCPVAALAQQTDCADYIRDGRR